ncbi:MAG: tetratricopeptide repeat protein [Bacteroidota bacterium]
MPARPVTLPKPSWTRSSRVARRVACAVLLVLSLGGGALVAQPASPALVEGVQAFNEGRFDEAILLLRTARAADPARPEVYAPLAAALLERGNLHEAEAVADDGLARFPELPALRLIKAELLLQRQAFREALPLYRALLDEGEAPGVERSALVQRLGLIHRNLASTAANEGRYADAIAALHAALRYTPADADLRYNLIALQLQEGDLDGANASVGAGLALAPNHPDLLRAQTTLLVNLGDAETLQRVLAQRYEQTPGDVEVGLAYGQVLLANREARRAAEVFEALLNQHPRDPRIYTLLIAVNERAFNLPGVIATLRRQMAAFPNDPAVRQALGQVHERQEDWSAARGVYDSLAVLDGQAFRARVLHTRTYEAEELWPQAQSGYEALAQVHPDSSVALLGLGRVLEVRSDWPAAESVYTQLLTLQPTSDAWIRLGWVAEQRGRVTQAERAYRYALEAGGASAFLHDRLARLVYARGDAPDALDHATEALRQGLATTSQLQRVIEAELSTSGAPRRETQPDGSMQPDQSVSGGAWAVSPQDTPARRLAEADALIESAVLFLVEGYAEAEARSVLASQMATYEASGRWSYLLAHAAEHWGEPDQAAAHYRDAIRLAPRYRPAHLALGANREGVGDNAEAALAYSRARALDEAEPDAYEALLRVTSADALPALADRWHARYRTTPHNTVLRAFVIEALTRVGRYDEAAAIAHH